jgi:hypothetical protein
MRLSLLRQPRSRHYWLLIPGYVKRGTLGFRNAGLGCRTASLIVGDDSGWRLLC